MKTRSIKYALDKDTRMPVYIQSAEQGLACNCVCPACEQAMVAVQGKSGNQKAWHFRHYTQQACNGGQDKVLQMMARQFILESNEIQIPEKILAYSAPQEAVTLDGILADARVISGAKPVYVEIAINHPVSEDKELVYRKKKFRVVEIDLTDISLDAPPEKLKELVLHTADRRMIYPRARSGGKHYWILPVAFWSLPVFALVGLFFGVQSTLKRKKRLRPF